MTHEKIYVYQIVLETVDEKKFVADFVGSLCLDNLQRLADEADAKTGRPITKLRSRHETRVAYMALMEGAGEPTVDAVRYETDETLPRDLIMGVVT